MPESGREATCCECGGVGLVRVITQEPPDDDERECRSCAGTGRETTALCPAGCGCRVDTDDADRRDCGCIGPCCYGWDAAPCPTPGCVGVIVTALYGSITPYCSSADADEPCVTPPAREAT